MAKRTVWTGSGVLAVLLALAAGCSADPPGCGDTTCTADQVCADGECRTVCNTSADCGAWQVCRQGTCQLAVCGDGRVEGSEECDAGNNNADSSLCTTLCKTAVCGDGLLLLGTEGCDDGQRNPGDGCNGSCAIEPGWTCPTHNPSVCLPTGGPDGRGADGANDDGGLRPDDATGADGDDWVGDVDGGSDADGDAGGDPNPCVPTIEGPTGDATCTDGKDNDCDGSPDLADAGCNITLSPVTALFAAAPGFTDYVARSTPALPIWQEAGSACPTATAIDASECAHAGVLRQSTVTGWDDCTNVTGADSEGALSWQCVEGPPMRLVSTGFLPGKGASDLLTPTAFETMSVTLLYGGTEVATSPTSVWWPNVVQPLPPAPSGVVALDQADRVYVVDGTMHGYGHNLDADGIAVVGLPGSRLSLNEAVVDNCNVVTGEIGGSGDLRECLLSAGFQERLWVEVQGELSATSPDSISGWGLKLNDTAFARVQRSSFTGGYGGIDVDSSRGVTLRDIRVDDMYNTCVILTDTRGVVVYGLEITNCGGAHAGTTGILVSVSAGANRVADVFIANTRPYGVFLYNGGIVTATHVTAVDQTYAALASASSQLHLSNAVVLDAADRSFMVQTASAANALAQVLGIEGTNGLFLRENNTATSLADIRLGSQTNTCNVQLAPNETLVEGTSCTPKAPPTPIVDLPDIVAKTITGGFTGAAETCASITTFDLGHFSAWIPDPTIQPTGGRCSPRLFTPCECRPFDWSPRGTNQDLIVGQAGLYGGVTFVPGGACPATVGADGVALAIGGTPYLINALEIIGDGIGNDNRFCESNEACWFTEDLGALLTSTDPARPTTAACIFAPAGGVSGVQLFQR